MAFVDDYLREVAAIAGLIDGPKIEAVAMALANLRNTKGRLFILGVGGSAANASHAVNDFRKLCQIECYAPTDNVAELTARTNDEGWATSFASWLRVSQLNIRDALLILSVGGGDANANVSPNLIAALDLARERGSTIFGIVGRNGGYTAQVATVVVMVPTVNEARITPHAEEFQGIIWHLLVSHPALKINPTKW